MTTNISIAIITLNEENNIGRCLESVNWADEVNIVDSGSSDRTIEIAKKWGAKVQFKKFEDYSNQKQYAIEQCKNSWVLLLDADEEVSSELRNKLQSITVEEDTYVGYKINRISEFLGKKVHNGEWGADYPKRFFKKEKGRMNGAKIHESVDISGPIGRIDEPIYHYPYSSMKEYIGKINKYSQLVAEQMVYEGRDIYFYDIFTHGIFKFFKTYLLKAGFLDGRRGLLLACFSSFYVMLKYTKAWEMVKINK